MARERATTTANANFREFRGILTPSCQMGSIRQSDYPKLSKR